MKKYVIEMKYRLVKWNGNNLQIGLESYTYDEACVAQMKLFLVGENFEIMEENRALGLEK